MMIILENPGPGDGRMNESPESNIGPHQHWKTTEPSEFTTLERVWRFDHQRQLEPGPPSRSD